MTDLKAVRDELWRTLHEAAELMLEAHPNAQRCWTPVAMSSGITGVAIRYIVESDLYIVKIDDPDLPPGARALLISPAANVRVLGHFNRKAAIAELMNMAQDREWVCALCGETARNAAKAEGRQLCNGSDQRTSCLVRWQAGERDGAAARIDRLERAEYRWRRLAEARLHELDALYDYAERHGMHLPHQRGSDAV